MEIIEQIGAYAGFAAVLGLAVLSALYFSQARDVKRLREWAGRAPERAAQLEAEAAARAAAAAQRGVQAQPQAKPAAPAVPAASPAATTAQSPQPSPAAAAAAKPAAATAVAAGEPRGADAEEKDAAAAPAASAAAAPEKPASPEPAGTGPATAAAGGPGTGGAPGGPASAPAANGASSPPRPTPPPLPSRAAPPQRVPPRPSGAATTVTPRRRDPWHRRIHWPAPRYMALLLAGILVVGAGAAFGVSQLLEEDEPARPGVAGEPLPEEENGEEGRAPAQPVNRSTVTVSVLNGTQVGGLAAQLADKLEREGFQKGNIDNALDQAQAESVVLYAPGAKREGREVAKVLGISQLEQVDADAQARGGNATVVVVVGADQTR